MFGIVFGKRSAQAAAPRCYETTVSFHFARNSEGRLVTVDNVTGKQIGEIVSMGDLICENRRFGNLAWGR